FNCKSDELNAKLLEESKKQGMDGLKGHRSVGGLRASIYNAMSQEGCKALADFMKDFAQRNG
ncbi:MAG: 3-phosphoserine/phosphohydroxythreonine transaminase, partial [Leptospiraceae bacterium]|nr:3-phosphoserine/phosphohydroxythreonine transaminase [Leptospiraceae bacterium]